MKVKHSEDVIKPQDDRTPDGVIHKALALWHLGYENWYATSFSLRRRFSKERTLSCRLRIAPVAALRRLVNSIVLGNVVISKKNPTHTQDHGDA